MIHRALALLLCLMPLASALAEPQRYEIDPVHTRVAFACKHLDFSQALGSFARPKGELWFDPKDWSSARIDVQIEIQTLDLGDAEWRTRMLKRDFFNSEKFPTARFKSTRVESTGKQTARIIGDLTLRGKTAPVTLEARLNDIGRHPYTFKNTIGFSATATLKRSDFGMVSLPTVVADKVDLRLELEATRERDAKEE